MEHTIIFQPHPGYPQNRRSLYDVVEIVERATKEYGINVTKMVPCYCLAYDKSNYKLKTSKSEKIPAMKVWFSNEKTQETIIKISQVARYIGQKEAMIVWHDGLRTNVNTHYDSTYMQFDLSAYSMKYIVTMEGDIEDVSDEIIDRLNDISFSNNENSDECLKASKSVINDPYCQIGIIYFDGENVCAEGGSDSSGGISYKDYQKFILSLFNNCGAHVKTLKVSSIDSAQKTL